MGEFPAGCTVLPRHPLLLLEHPRELEVLEPWALGLSRCLAGGWMLQLLLLLQLGFSGLSWHYLLCPGSDGISVMLQCFWGLWGEPKIDQPFVKMSPYSYCDSSFWAQAEKKYFTFGSHGLSYCCFLPLSREDWKFVCLGLSLIKAFFLLCGKNI